jgi:hypothetical protein
MTNIYKVTYRNCSGGIKTENLPASNYFDSAAAVCQSHHLKTTDIISNVIQSEGIRKPKKRMMPGRRIGKRAYANVK